MAVGCFRVFVFGFCFAIITNKLKGVFPTFQAIDNFRKTQQTNRRKRQQHFTTQVMLQNRNPGSLARSHSLMLYLCFEMSNTTTRQKAKRPFGLLPSCDRQQLVGTRIEA